MSECIITSIGSILMPIAYSVFWLDTEKHSGLLWPICFGRLASSGCYMHPGSFIGPAWAPEAQLSWSLQPVGAKDWQLCAALASGKVNIVFLLQNTMQFFCRLLYLFLKPYMAIIVHFYCMKPLSDMEYVTPLASFVRKSNGFRAFKHRLSFIVMMSIKDEERSLTGCITDWFLDLFCSWKLN